MTDHPIASKSNDCKNSPSPEVDRDEKAAPPRYKVSDLLGEAREAILEHGGEEYRLRITANRKLILTK
jgi:hemin uptake protein HemP